MEGSLISQTDKVERKLAVGEGVVVRGGGLQVSRSRLEGFRLGLVLEGVAKVQLKEVQVVQCSIGLQLPSLAVSCKVQVLGSCSHS